MQKPAPVVSSDARNKNLKPPFPRGYCWKFHRGEKCSGCNFNHECFKCGSQHPANKRCVFPGEQQIKNQTCREQPPQQQLHLANQPLRPALSRRLSTPIKVDKLQAYLDGYPFRSRQYLIDGFRFVFSIDYVGLRSNCSSTNLLSVITNPKAVGEKLDKEIQLGTIVGPFDNQPFPVFHISPLALIPKQVPAEIRFIHHMSFPEGRSISSHIGLDKRRQTTIFKR